MDTFLDKQMDKFKNMLEEPIYLATKVDVTPRNKLIRNVQDLYKRSDWSIFWRYLSGKIHPGLGYGAIMLGTRQGLLNCSINPI